jgi:uncharacterized protein
MFIPWRCVSGAVAPVLLGVFLVLGCQPAEPGQVLVTRETPIVPLRTGVVRVETHQDTFGLSVEIAETPEQKGIGLMDRQALGEDEGMLFLYPEEQPGSAAFYMFRTLVPLSIAYLDSAGHIVSILDMEPCDRPVAAWCDRYAPGVPYHAALEVNQGLFGARRVGVGDRIVLEAIDE